LRSVVSGRRRVLLQRDTVADPAIARPDAEGAQTKVFSQIASSHLDWIEIVD